MEGFVDLVCALLVEAGLPEDCILKRRRLELPGWFRAEKKWDLVVVRDGQLLAAAEFKSHVGPSFGNNFNNRSEEAIGSATDIWAAYREGAFAASARPWLGYLMLLEDCDGSSRPVTVAQPSFSVFPEFENASYRERYRLLAMKLLRERLYDSACLLLSSPTEGRHGGYSEPDPELAFDRFVNPLLARFRA